MALILTNEEGGLVLYLTVKQLCHQLDITLMTLYHWRKEGLDKLIPGGIVRPAIPHKLIDRGSMKGVVFYPPDVLAWLKEWRPNFVDKFINGAGCVCKHCSRKRIVAHSIAGSGTKRPLKLRQIA